MHKQVTMQAIADEAGVSTATVSRVLKGHPAVLEETRQKVQSLIDRYHYVPNFAASSLVRQQSNMLGMMVENIENPYFASMFSAAETRALEEGYSLMMMTEQPGGEEIQTIRRLIQHQIDGLVLLSNRINGRPPEEKIVRFVQEIAQQVPLVLINEYLEDLHIPCVFADNREGFLQAFRFLYHLGHRRIALVGGLDDNQTFHIRRQAYLDFLKEAGLPFQEAYLQMNGYTFEDAMNSMHRIMSSAQLPTAILANNNIIAMGIMRVCHDHHIHIPDHLSLITCDNTFISEAVTPSLTALDIDPREQGRQAIDILLSMIRGETPPSLSIRIPSRLVVRSSTARPPA